MTPRRRALLAGALGFAAALVCAAGAGAAITGDAAWKAAHDTDPHLPLTPYQLQMLAQKEQAVASYFSAVSGSPVTVEATATSGAAVMSVDPAMLSGMPASASLPANQIAQQTGYWCGPAAVQEALGQVGVSMTQATAAARLGTTSAGTAWSGGHTATGHPVPDVLNQAQSRNYYIPQAVPVSPSSGDVSNYKSYLLNNINYPMAPLVGDAWETQTSSYHLTGHPRDRTIFHWFDIRGYTASGANTMYEDSVHNAPTVSWYAGVPAYSTLPSSWIVTIVGGRGYVW